ncbi:SDR family oxidoreductase [Zhongshania sp.]|jgi:NAD(P)-dependent dehydrogenase (short-subunit alcohol dehydrogenase family)|uniref:SDR family oxidoreductase n=1 Tax=Zhongshania sp. TaxID=1971902 RepID=UPI0039E554F4
MQTSDTLPITIVIGASGALASACIHAVSAMDDTSQIVAISRGRPAASDTDRLSYLQCDNSEAEIGKCIAELSPLRGKINRVIICNGRLHDENIKPEKRLEDISAENMMAIMQINTLIPILWMKALAPLLKSPQACVMAVFSARVGSITNNHLGGWYSYRMSKAALNMGIRSAAIEYGRRAKNVRLLAFHPGTTDSALSRPFQASVPEGKLFSPAFVADSLLELMQQTSNTIEDSPAEAAFIDWEHKTIPW